MPDIDRKLVLVGPTRAGKTLLLRAWKKQIPSATLPPTLSAEIFCDQVGELRLHVWDEPGDPRFEGTLAAYERFCDAALLCFDAADAECFYKCVDALAKFRARTRHDCKVFLCGICLPSSESHLVQQAREFAKRQGLEFLLCRPLHEDVAPLFRHLCQALA